MSNVAAETLMRDHVERFWRILETETVRILIDMRRDTSSVPYWDSSSFPDAVAKALVAERTAANQSGSERAGVDALREALKPFADAVYSDNGDVTLSTHYIKTADYLRARNVYRAALTTPPAQPAPEGGESSTSSDGTLPLYETAGGFPVAAAPYQAEETGVIQSTRQGAGVERGMDQCVTGGESAATPSTHGKPDGAVREPVWQSNLREAWSALAMIRETVETLGPVGAMKASEHLDGPTFMHEAEAIVAGIAALHSHKIAAAETSRERYVPIVGSNEYNGTVQTYCTTCDKLLSVTPDIDNTAPAVSMDAIALGDTVRMNENSPYFQEWRGVEMKVVGLHLAPDGGLWADVIEGDPRHRGNGQYDSETTGIDALHLSRIQSDAIIAVRLDEAAIRADEREKFGFVQAMDIAERGFETWAAKDHNAKWVRRIDGTPIKNDLLVNIAEAFRSAIRNGGKQP